MTDLNARAAEITDAENDAALEPHDRLEGAVRARAASTCRRACRRRSRRGTRTRSTCARGRAAGSGTSTATSTSTSTTGSAAMVVGHAHPKVAEAIERAARTGTHFAAPTEATVLFAEELCRRFGADVGALLQLGHRGDDERDPRRPRRHRPRAHREDRRLVPRAPRRGDVLGRARTPTSMGGREAPATTPMSNGIPAVDGRVHARRAVQRPRGARRALLDERGDEIACLILEPVMMNIGICQPRARLPPGPRGPAAPARRAAHLRRGEERRDGRRRRRGRALRRAARPRVLGQGDRRRHPGRRVRRPGRRDGRDRPRRRAAGHVQRQPARRRGRARHAHRGADARRVRLPRQARHPPGRGLRQGDGRERHPRPRGRPRREGLRVLPARAAAELPRLPRDQPGPLPRVVPVGDEPRRLHDARATRSSGRSRCSTPRPTSTATSTSSPTSAPPSPPPDRVTDRRARRDQALGPRTRPGAGAPGARPTARRSSRSPGDHQIAADGRGHRIVDRVDRTRRRSARPSARGSRGRGTPRTVGSTRSETPTSLCAPRPSRTRRRAPARASTASRASSTAVSSGASTVAPGSRANAVRTTSGTASTRARRGTSWCIARCTWRAATSRAPSSSPTSAARPTNASSCAIALPPRRRSSATPVREVREPVRTAPSAPSSTWYTAPRVTPSSCCCGASSQSSVVMPASRRARDGGRASRRACRPRPGATARRRPSRTGPASRGTRRAGRIERARTASTSAAATNTRRRGPHPWSVDRGVSNPRISEPQPSSPAACRHGATTGRRPPRRRPGSARSRVRTPPRRDSRRPAPRRRVAPSIAAVAMGQHDEWVARDAAVVWHGFTQMSSYADNAPVVVDHAEGHEVIDVDGRRYLDAISSLWVTTLGHHVPELDDALDRPARARARTPRCSATATRSWSSSPRRSPGSCRSTTRTSSTRPTARARSSRR